EFDQNDIITKQISDQFLLASIENRYGKLLFDYDSSRIKNIIYLNSNLEIRDSIEFYQSRFANSDYTNDNSSFQNQNLSLNQRYRYSLDSIKLFGNGYQFEEYKFSYNSRVVESLRRSFNTDFWGFKTNGSFFPRIPVRLNNYSYPIEIAGVIE